MGLLCPFHVLSTVRIAVIPAFEEALTIGSTVLRAGPHVDRVIVVDDGSTDLTAEVAERAGAMVLSHETNAGKGTALRTGIRAAFDAGANVLVLLDGDGQHDPERIPDLVAPIERGDVDMVIGSRTQRGDGSAPHHRRFGRRILDWTTNRLSGTAFTDTQSGFRAIDAELLRRVVPDESGFGFESALLRNARRAGANVTEVDVRDNYPPEASPSVDPVTHAIAVTRSLFRAVRREHPLLAFGTVGIVSLMIGVYLGIDTATHYYATREFWPGRAMLSMLFSIVGVQLLLGAMILDLMELRSRGM